MSTPAIAPVPQKQDIRAFPVSIDSLDPAILKMDLYLKTGGRTVTCCTAQWACPSLPMISAAC